MEDNLISLKKKIKLMVYTQSLETFLNLYILDFGRGMNTPWCLYLVPKWLKFAGIRQTKIILSKILYVENSAF